MHGDFKAGRPHTEVESLTGYMVKAGLELGIKMPHYTAAYNYLGAKMTERL